MTGMTYVVDRSSSIFKTGTNGWITRSAITYIPLLEYMKEMSDEHAATEYKTAASTSTCNMGTFLEA
jgi:hypothetical protein